MKTIAVILAGGLGLRVGGDKPKQLLKIEGKPIVIHSLQAFELHPLVDEIILVVNAKFREDFESLLQNYSFKKLEAITIGGKERSDSTRNALELIAVSKDIKVLIHDAVRPFVSQEVITEVVGTLDHYEAVNVGISATDTVLVANEAREIASVPPRKDIFLAQTPQGFRADVLHSAYCLAAKDKDFVVTDDCSVVHRYLADIPIAIVKGEIENRKITFPSDLL